MCEGSDLQVSDSLLSYERDLQRCWMMWSMVGLKREFIASGLILNIPCEDHLTKSTLQKEEEQVRNQQVALDLQITALTADQNIICKHRSDVICASAC